MSDTTIESILHEQRLFQPAPEFSQGATVNSLAAYEELYTKAAADPAAFWGELAQQ
jgi:acetyl-CoA synthetase